MGRITLTIDTEDVATLREVFHLALIQSEAVLDDAASGIYSDEPDDDTTREARKEHNAACALMARIDAMLPDSTGFFD